MSLKEKLASFNKQNEKLQASLLKMAKSSSSSRKAPPIPIPAPPSSSLSLSSTQPSLAPPTQRLSFLNDKEKLQQIATIRKSPVGAQIKRVIDVLFETRQALLPEEINEMCFVDVKNNKEVFDNLKSNVKVSFDGQRFAYKSKHDLKNKQELLVLIRKAPEGVPTGELKDAYVGVFKDLQELKAGGQIWLLMNSDSQEDIVYPNDPKIQIKVDDDVKELFRSIEMPREFVDVERELQKVGMKPATNSLRRKAAAGVQGSQQKKPKAKKQRDFKRTKLTNVHLPELFQNFTVPDV